MRRRCAAVALGLALLLCGCAQAPALRLIGMQQLAPDLQVDGTLVGGISGLDYDARHDQWWLASDDRGEHAPARLYRARIAFDAAGAPTLTPGAAVLLRQPDGARYPARGAPGVAADIEALRSDPRDGSLWFASEGDRTAGVPSFVRRVDTDGRHLGDLAYPDALQIRPGCACGGRSNLGLEGMAFTPDGAHLWLALETPPLQDGPVAVPGQGALTRISQVTREGTMVAQYAYPLDGAPAPAFDGGFVDNGLSEILVLDETRLLVLERAGRQIHGRQFAFDVRLYEVDLADASRLDPDAPLARQPQPLRAARKRLLIDSARLPPGWSDNYEAMAWGPALGGADRTLVIASDNNFSGTPTRFLLFDASALAVGAGARRE